MTAHFVNLLDDLQRRSLRMASMVEDMVHEACDAVFEANEPLARRILRRDEEVDTEEVAVESEVIRLMALYQPVGVDLRRLCTVLKVNNDLERVADCAVNVAERARHLELQPLANENPLLKQMCPLVRRHLRNSVHSYSMDDSAVAEQVRRDEQVIDELYAELVQQMVRLASGSPERMAAHLDVLSVAKNLERIADHATNIAEDVIYLTTGSIIRHQPQGS